MTLSTEAAPRDVLIDAVAALAEFPGEGSARSLVRAVARASALLLGDGLALERCNRAVRAFAEVIGAHRVAVFERVCDAGGDHRYVRQVVYQSPAYPHPLFPEPLTVGVLGMERQDAQLASGQPVYLHLSSFRSGHPARSGEFGLLLFVVPVLVEGAAWGAVTMANLEREQRWSASEEAVIVALGTLLGAAIERERRAQRELERQEHVDWLARRLLDTGTIAHDLNNLLLAIYVVVDTATADAGDRAILENALDRARTLTGELLAIAHSHETRPLATPVALDELVRHTARTISIPSGVALDLSAVKPVEIRGVSHVLARIVANLLQNAVEALADRSGRVSVFVQRRSAEEAELARASWRSTRSKPGEHGVLIVEDTGVGMQPAVLERVFEPFFTTRPTGHGLGMLSVLRAVDAHRGAIAITTEPGQGTRVTVYLALD